MSLVFTLIDDKHTTVYITLSTHPEAPVILDLTTQIQVYFSNQKTISVPGQTLKFEE